MQSFTPQSGAQGPRDTSGTAEWWKESEPLSNTVKQAAGCGSGDWAGQLKGPVSIRKT